jgi:hypothetical protein
MLNLEFLKWQIRAISFSEYSTDKKSSSFQFLKSVILFQFIDCHLFHSATNIIYQSGCFNHITSWYTFSSLIPDIWYENYRYGNLSWKCWHIDWLESHLMPLRKWIFPPVVVGWIPVHFSSQNTPQYFRSYWGISIQSYFCKVQNIHIKWLDCCRDHSSFRVSSQSLQLYCFCHSETLRQSRLHSLSKMEG